MTERRARCSCGQLTVSCRGEPVRISVCHCTACQKRTGSVFGAQARFRRSDVTAISGISTAWIRTADSGNRLTFHFCPKCGSTVYYELEGLPDVVAIPTGAFADPAFPAPRVSVYESRKHHWVLLDGSGGLEHFE